MISVSELLAEVVEPNVNAFSAEPGNRRLGLNAVWALDSLASHVFHDLKGAGLTHESKDSFYKAKLAESHDCFKMIWDVSTAGKHAARLQQSKLVLSSQEITSVRAEGWLAYFSGIADHREWGDRIYIANERFGLRPLDEEVRKALGVLKREYSKLPEQA